jgi:hypothetical protein
MKQPTRDQLASLRRDAAAPLRRDRQLPPVRVTLEELEARAAAAGAAGMSLSDWIRARTSPRPPRKRRAV